MRRVDKCNCFREAVIFAKPLQLHLHLSERRLFGALLLGLLLFHVLRSHRERSFDLRGVVALQVAQQRDERCGLQFRLHRGDLFQGGSGFVRRVRIVANVFSNALEMGEVFEVISRDLFVFASPARGARWRRALVCLQPLHGFGVRPDFPVRQPDNQQPQSLHRVLLVNCGFGERSGLHRGTVLRELGEKCKQVIVETAGVGRHFGSHFLQDFLCNGGPSLQELGKRFVRGAPTMKRFAYFFVRDQLAKCGGRQIVFSCEKVAPGIRVA